MRRATTFALALLLMVLAHIACAEAAITRKAQLNQANMTVGVNTGSASSLIVEKELPNAQLVYFEDNATAYEAVAQGKIDAYIFDRVQIQQAIRNGRGGVHLLDENMDETVKVAVGISPVSAIPDIEGKLGEFLTGLRQDGTLAEMYHRWAEAGDTAMPEIQTPAAPEYHLKVGTAGIVPPFSYYVGTELNGYDIEMARRFAAWLNADLEFKVYDFGAIIPAAVSGDVDCIMSNLNVTEERRETIKFSEIIYENAVGILVRGEDPAGLAGAGHPAGGITALDQLDGGRIGVQTGTTASEVAAQRLPHAKVEFFSTFPDMAVALENNKIDGFLGDWLVLSQMARENPVITVLDEKLNTYDCGFVLAKNARGRALCEEINAWIADMRERGELDRILKKWTEGPESEQTLPDYRSLPAPKGVLTMATEGTFPPMNFYRGEDCVGMEIELCALFCQACGYGLNVTTMDFGSGMLQAVSSGKVDFAISGIAITEERKQSVLFSDPYYTGGMSAMVLKASPAAGQDKPSFWAGIAASFNKTFLRENRWQLFVKGILTTLVITVAAIIFGTALGFLVFMLCRNGNPLANRLTRFSLWLVQGMPMVVLLMILYYVIFGSVAINGVVVAVIGFTLTFGASVFGLLKMGVGAVDPGQYEAAYALGYSNRRTFFRIILPQALPHVLPAYRGEIVGLIKATAVVGYIAVQDLTKMGDIVRSRTYEAFFPLIAVTVIYFALEGLIGLFVSRISVNFDPKRRKPNQILKGVKTDDPN